jgi:putative protease
MTPAATNRIELLAPAANADIGIAAIHHGADAVYIGGPAFGARANAGNTVADIARLVNEAHRFRARIFVTLNTILREDELEAARRLVHQLHDIGVDALIVQDMALLNMDLPPIQLHASTQTDIRTPEKARFLQDVGFSQMVLARELTLPQIQDIAQTLDHAVLEFFIHGALCVAYSGQCYISHAQTGRSANRGDCSQACRLPYTVSDTQGRIVAHDSHVLSLKDNDQTLNLDALINAGVRSFKIEGRYKDMAYVKNITAHYRQHLDQILTSRTDLQAASSGRCQFFFEPDPSKNFHRGHTDYFVRGRQIDIGAFDSPKFSGLPLGHVVAVADDHLELTLDQPDAVLNNGDGLTYYTLQNELVGVALNRVQCLDPEQRRWRAEPNEDMASLPDLRAGTALNRNRDQAWNRRIENRTADRRLALDWTVTESDDGLLTLHAVDEDGVGVALDAPQSFDVARQTDTAQAALIDALGKLGGTVFQVRHVTIGWQQARFVPASVANAWRRDAIAALEAEQARRFDRLPRAMPVAPPARYPENHLSYLGNVANSLAADFYARHGVDIIEPAYEAHAEPGEVSLMITRHCIRFSLSLCPKQAKGVKGVQGTVRAEPLTMVNGREKLRLVFDCKACEMHVMGSMKKSVMRQVAAVPVTFHARRPDVSRPAEPA